MCLESDVVERHLGCPVHRVGEVPGRHLAQASRRRAERHELGCLGLQKQRADGLEELNHAEHVHLEVLEQVGDLHFVHRWEHLRDARVRNDDVQVGDALALDILDGCSGVGFGNAVDFDNDQGAAFAGGELFQRGRCARVAHGADDDVVGASEVLRRETVAQSYSFLPSALFTSFCGNLRTSASTGNENSGV